MADTKAAQAIAQYRTEAVPTAGPDWRAGRVKTRLGEERFTDVSVVFVIDGAGKLVGGVRVTEVLPAHDDTPMAALLETGLLATVAPDLDREDAASIAIRSNALMLAVCHGDGTFIGAVPPGALLSVLRDEHLEDLHHMVGILARSNAAQDALTGPPHRRAFYRLPWLLIGLAGSAAATAMMVSFEAVLNANIAVAFFVPAIVYLADAVGTQTEAAAVRGISLTGASVARLLAGELATGLLIGLTLGLVSLGLVWATFGDPNLAIAIAATLTLASAIASSVGFLLPLVFDRLGSDPALGSGPIATVLQDVLTLFVYFVVCGIALG
ncbi:MAG: magnesium transporter [Alphaproteobacteria bacterium]|nr:magnesium transporter [Alphaproteobacteria bacterium]